MGTGNRPACAIEGSSPSPRQSCCLPRASRSSPRLRRGSSPPPPRTAPVTTPEYGQPGTGYSGEDLAFDDDARDELYLRDLAEDLNWDPWALYNHVRNSYRCAPYWGSMKGAAGAYWDGEGNDMDLAALLVALLPASNIPARDVQGMIQVTSAQAQEFTGLADARA